MKGMLGKTICKENYFVFQIVELTFFRTVLKPRGMFWSALQNYKTIMSPTYFFT